MDVEQLYHDIVKVARPMQMSNDPNYNSPEIVKSKYDNFYKALERFNPVPETGKNPLKVVEIGDCSPMSKYFRKTFNLDIDYVKGASVIGADVIVTRNPPILHDSKAWTRKYKSMYRQLNNGGILIASFITEEEAKFVKEKIKVDFHVDNPAMNPYSTEARYMVDKGFVSTLEKVDAAEFARLGINIGSLVKKLAQKVGQIDSFEYDKYVLIAVKKEKEVQTPRFDLSDEPTEQDVEETDDVSDEKSD